MALRDAPRVATPGTARPDIRLVQSERRAAPPARTHRRRPWDSFFMRVLGGSLLVSLPVVAILGLLTFQEGEQTSTAAATARRVAATAQEIAAAAARQGALAAQLAESGWEGESRFGA